MIDLRLAEGGLAERIEAARSTLPKYPHLAELERWVALWWLEWRPSCPMNGDTCWPPEALYELHRACPFDDKLHQQIEQQIARPSWDSLGGSMSGLILARIFGRALGEGPVSLEHFRRAVHVGFRDGAWGHEFFGEFAAAVRPVATASWIKELSDLPTSIEGCLEPLRPSEDRGWVRALEQSEDRRRAAGEATELWGLRDPRSAIPNMLIAPRLRALFALSAEAALVAFDRLPATGLRSLLIFFLGLNEDRDALMEGLKKAPLVWDAQRWTGHTLAPVFLDALTNYAGRLAATTEWPDPKDSDPAAIEQLWTQELPNLFKDAFALLLTRGDGRWLGIDYASVLLRQANITGDQRQGRIERLALDTLMSTLRDHKVQGADVQRLSRRRICNAQGAAASWSRHLDFASVAGALVDSPAEGQRVWARFVELLLSPAKGCIIGTTDPDLIGTPLISYIGRALAATTSPANTWASAWSELFQQRERSRFSVLPVEGLLPSVFLAITGVAALQFLVRGSRSEAMNLWINLETALRRLAATIERHNIGLQICRLLAVLWAFVPHMEPENWPSMIVERRGELHSDPFRCLLTADLLVRNGLARVIVLEVMANAGCDPLVVGQGLLDWLIAKGLGTQIEGADVAHLLAGLRNIEADG